MSRRRSEQESGLIERHIGQCQICEGDFKLANGRLVHHGYNRPGYGHIVGGCPGVGELPYEASCDAIKPYLGRARADLVAMRRRMQEFENDEVTQLTAVEYARPGGPNAEMGQVEVLPIDRYQARVTYDRRITPSWQWKVLRQEAMGALRRKISDAENYVARLEQRIANWHPRPIRTVEEFSETERSKTSEQSAEKARAKAEKARAKAEKEALTAAKRLEQDRKTLERMQELEPEVDALKTRIRQLASEMGKLFREPNSQERSSKQYEVKRQAHLALDHFVGPGGLIGKSHESRFIRLLEMKAEFDELGIW